MEKKRISRQIYVSETAEQFLQKIKQEGGDDMAFAGVLFEMAIQMVRNGHITWNENGFECKTDKGVVTINVRKPGDAPSPASSTAAPKPATAPASRPIPDLAGIAKSMKAGSAKPAPAAKDDKKDFDS